MSQRVRIGNRQWVVNDYEMADLIVQLNYMGREVKAIPRESEPRDKRVRKPDKV